MVNHSRAVVWETPASEPSEERLTKLAHPVCAETDETPEIRKVAYLPYPAHVTLDVGLEIVAQRLPRVELLVEDARVEP